MKKLVLVFLLIQFAFAVFAEIKLPRLIGDGVVLQRDVDLKIWGWASANESVALTLKGKKYKAKADALGNWLVKLPPQRAGGPFELTVKGTNEIVVNDVYFGDVWVCSGQSNMTVTMERVKEKYPDEVKNANNPEIRYFFIPTLTSLEGPLADFPQGTWKKANPDDILSFSAIAYFFAKKVYEKYHIPIGLVNSSVGGTPIEAWISEEGLKEFPGLTAAIQQYRNPRTVSSFRTQARQPQNQRPQDVGLAEKWYEPSYIPKGWRNFNIPGFWEDQGLKDLNGVVWFRKEVEIPASMAGEPAKLFMGRIVDADFVYVNGHQVGNITYQYPPRRYEVPAGILNQGKNIIVARVINTNGKGGFVPDKPYYLEAGNQTIDLKGDWQYKVGEAYKPAGFGFGGGGGFSAQNQPAALYNAMIAPLENLRIKGFLWYQGESNVSRPESYRKLLPALINDWRVKWAQGELPFLYVQLANFQDIDFLPAESQWAELRDAQLQALLVPNTAMAVAIDLGEWNDIHPLNKKDVGERLALGALRLAYGEKGLASSGPVYKSYETDGNKIVVYFDETGSGLITNDEEPIRRFEIAGPDGKYVWANAEIKGNTVVVWDENIPVPERVRYAWADNPADANLYNKEGLPASPFQTYNKTEMNKVAWQGRKCAVALTYDDALNVHLDNVVPLLDSAGFKGTFYIAGSFQGFQSRVNDWKWAAFNGHELGNHTLYHPCDASLPGREWVSPETDLSKYTVKKITDEIRLNNVILKAVDGKSKRTFAFACGDMKVGNEPFFDTLASEFSGARGVGPGMHKYNDIDLYNIDSYMINGETGEQMINLVKKAMESNSLLVFMFHGVGGEHSLNVSLEAHRELVDFLKQNEDKVWTTTLVDAAEHIKGLKP